MIAPFASTCSPEYALHKPPNHTQNIEIITESISTKREDSQLPQSRGSHVEPATASVPQTPKKPKKTRFERTPDHEIFVTQIISNELEQAETILKDFAANPDYSVDPKTYNALLGAWIKQGDINRSLGVWSLFARYGVRRSVRSYTLLLNGLIQCRRSALLPKYIESLEKSKFRPERILADRFYLKESTRVPYTLTDPKNMDPKICIKLPPSCPLPDGTYYTPTDDSSTESPIAKQIKSERSRIEESVRVYTKCLKQINELGRTAQMSPGRKLMIKWFVSLRNRIEAEQRVIEKKLKENTKVEFHQTQLLSLPADKLAVITMHEVISSIMMNSQGAAFGTTCASVGKAIQAEIKYTQIKKELKLAQQKWIQKRAKNTYQRLRSLKKFEGDAASEWDSTVNVKVGSSLVALLIENAKVECKGDDLFDVGDLPAFTHEIIHSRKRQKGVIRAHEEVMAQLDPGSCEETLSSSYHAKLMPMYVAPKAWESSRSSPYLHADAKLMRTYSASQEHTLKVADLTDVCELLTILGKVPWRINSRVYDVVNEGWNRGGNLPYVPGKQSIRSPTPPPDFRENPEARLLWRREKNKTNQKNQERFSLRCDFMLKKNTAEALLGEDAFFFPHNMDFRGRCYPIPPHLNHIGSDVCRGLLQFAEGKPLGERGLYWLKAHLASLCGVNKVSFDDRVKYTEDHIADIIDSAENPLDGNRWWLEADDAWQALSCCFELRDALRMKDPTKYVSHVPIHMDGSCNGLQHYAALGGDIEGGKSVNLLPADCPQDVYAHVLRIVRQKIEEDAAAGNELAEKLVGKVIRKTIKQTVMTSVYGVTYIGARKQIAGQLRDQEVIPDEKLFEASIYVTKITFAAMQSMFTGARQIMAWLGDTARAVSRTGTTMQWTTPIGIPAEQHYRRPGRLQVKTLLQSVTLAERYDDLPVLVQKQRSAFPPNYVHSLDSTHMFKTAKLCHDAGLTFAAVHDSFW
eukprot:CAMPEP_0206208796 /NCGR_PEP_ID=MMETSP0166-20121206/16501_1 /ASSEMBLY_ACC=CAM_ASM_000260 /TAXON_ID=95228 /ORGANISM="Vannella robusta, Strain DIVA3 518/3/11/1/6" /LENGTH=973 /DNA_ID=CAMNT_0053630019 /DNA_START=211 /DNA_END=3129 /DNA_ORIENTATION=-